MKGPAPKRTVRSSRRGWRPTRLLIEVLEDRLAPSVLIPVTDRKDIVYDNTRGILDITASDGTLQRFSVASQQQLPALTVGTTLLGADITPDGSNLYVAEGTTGSGGGVLHDVNLSSGAVTNLTYSLGGGEDGGWDVAIGADGIGFITGQFAGSGWVPLHQLNTSTNQITNRTDDPGSGGGGQVRQDTKLTRGADGSLMLLTESNISSGPMFTYYSAANAFGPSVGTDMFLDNDAAAINRNGTLIGLEVNGGVAIMDSHFNAVTYLSGDNGGMVFDPSQDVLYAVNATTNTIDAYNTDTWALKYTMPVGETTTAYSPFGNGMMAVSNDAQWLFLSTPSGVREYHLPPATGVASSLVFSGLSSFVAGGVSTSFTVTALDPAGNIATGYRGTVTFTSSDPGALLPKPYTFSSGDQGVHTFNVTFNTAGPQTVTISDAVDSLSATSPAVTVHTQPTNLIPVYSTSRDLVYDPVRGLLYITTAQGTVQRYDLATQSLLSPFIVGTSLAGADITADSNSLYVADTQVNAAQGVYEDVNLNNGTVTDVGYTRAFYETGAWDVAIDRTATAYADTEFAGSGWVPLRSINVATNAISIVTNDPGSGGRGQVRQNTLIWRSADRSLLLFTESNISDGPIFTYNATTGTYSQPFDTNAFLDSVVSAVNRNGTLIAMELNGGAVIMNDSFATVKTLPGANGGIAFDPVRDLLYTADVATGEITVYNTNTWATVDVLNIGETITAARPFGNGMMTVSSDGRYLFFATAQGVLVYDLSELQASAPPLNLTENTPFNGVVATFTDADGNTQPGAYTATITWGDGSTSVGSVATAQNGFSVSGSHTYATPGSYSLSVSIQDTDNDSTSASATATVADAPLTAVAVQLPGAFDHQAVGGVVATFTDADPAAVVGDYTASITWGDGHSSAGMVGVGSEGGFTVSGGNTYAHEGTYTITIAIKDFGGSTASVSSQIVITDGALNAAFVPLTGTDGAAVGGVVATFTDSDPNGNLSEYSADINWGDGHSSGGVIASDGHGGFTVSGTNTYAKQGSYTVSVAIYDDGGASANVQGAATITDPPLNGAFVPFSGTDNTAVGGVVATFTDSDPNGYLAEYSATITWGDGHSASGVIANDGHGGFTVSGTNAYALAGTYNVSVSIADVGGASLAVSGQVTINDPALHAQFVPISGMDGTPASGVVATFTDPDPNGTLAQYSATISWGDGHSSSGVIAADGHGGYTVSAANAYATAGTYNVTVALMDVGGTTTTVSGTATITDPPLNVQFGSISGTDGVAVGGVIATFTDPDANGHLSEYSATINWGDGNSGTGVIAANGQGGFTVSGTNIYAVQGVYAVSVVIVDVGGTTSHASGTATITDPPLTATFVPFASTVAAPVSGVIATFKDADPNGSLSEYSATIHWGDGVTSAGSLAAVSSGGFSVSGSHTYATQGSFTVTVAIADRGGAGTTAHGPVTIGDALITASVTPFRAGVNTPLQRVVATFSDADLTRIAADFTATISWGDGSSSSGVVSSSTAGNFTVTGGHTYAKTGVYSLAVGIRDSGGASANPQGSVLISGPLAITGNTLNALPGSPFSGVVASFSGGDPTLGAGDYAAKITWADGSTSAGAVAGNPASGFTVNVNRVAGAPGISSFNVLVADDEGDSVSTAGTLDVEPPPQTLAIADNGSQEVFAVTRGGQLYAHQNATGWRFLGAYIHSIGAVAEKSGNIVLFAVTTDHALFRLDAQSGWRMIGAPQTVLSVSVGTDASGRADAFVISRAADLLDYDVVTGWSLIGGRGSILSTSATANGEVVVVTADRRVAEYGPQSGWQLLSGPGFAQSVSAVTEPSGRFVVLAATTGGTLDWNTSSDGWTGLGAANLVQTLTAGTDEANYADAFVLGGDGSLQEYRVATGLAEVPQGGPGSVQQVIAGDDGLAVVVTASDAVFLYSDALGWIPLTSAGFMNL